MWCMAVKVRLCERNQLEDEVIWGGGQDWHEKRQTKASSLTQYLLGVTVNLDMSAYKIEKCGVWQ